MKVKSNSCQCTKPPTEKLRSSKEPANKMWSSVCQKLNKTSAWCRAERTRSAKPSIAPRWYIWKTVLQKVATEKERRSSSAAVYRQWRNRPPSWEELQAFTLAPVVRLLSHINRSASWLVWKRTQTTSLARSRTSSDPKPNQTAKVLKSPSNQEDVPDFNRSFKYFSGVSHEAHSS